MKNLTLFLLIFVMPFNAFSQDKEPTPNSTKPKMEMSETMQKAQTAELLIRYGYDNNAPLALIEAARILSAAPYSELKPEKSELSTGSKGAKTAKNYPNNPKELLEKAISMAGKDANVKKIAQGELAVLKKASENVSKGAKFGPAKVLRIVYAETVSKDYVIFEGGELAEVSVCGDGETDLDLYVYDEKGILIAQDYGSANTCFVSFQAKTTGSYKILIVNNGTVFNNCLLLTN